MNFSWVIKIGVPFHDYAVIMQILVPFGILFLSLLLFFLIKYFKKKLAFDFSSSSAELLYAKVKLTSSHTFLVHSFEKEWGREKEGLMRQGVNFLWIWIVKNIMNRAVSSSSLFLCIVDLEMTTFFCFKKIQVIYI